MSTNYIDQITDTQSTPVTHDIQEATDFRIFRATCSTAAATAAKVATLQDPKNFSLATGVRVAVTFQYGNNAASPTLRVDGSSTGTAKSIAFPTDYNLKTTENGAAYNTWGPYETVIFTYDGTYWINSGSGLSIYRAYKADSKVAQNNVADGSEHRVLLSYSANNTDETNTSYKTGNVTVTPGSSSTGTALKVKGTDSGAGYIQMAAYNSGSPQLKINSGSYSTTIMNNNSLASNISVQLPSEGGTLSVKDENMKWTASTTTNTYYPLQSTSTAATSTANTLNSVSFYQYYNTAGGYRRLILGNTTAYTSTGGAYGTIRLYGTGATYYGDLNPGTIGANSLTANRTWTLPDKTGTIALTSDIPSVSGKLDTTHTSGTVSGQANWNNGTLELIINESTANVFNGIGINPYGVNLLGMTGSTDSPTAQAMIGVTYDGTINLSAGTSEPIELTISDGYMAYDVDDYHITFPTEASGNIALTSDIPRAGTSASAVGTSASGGSASTYSKSDHVHNITSTTITTALGYTPYNSTNPNGYTTNTGTVTSVRVQATSPITSSVNTAQTGTLNTTIALANNYGDTKNPYASKTKNYVLAAPATAAGTPSFRALVKSDIPTLDYVSTSNPYVTSQGTVSGGWMYRVWSNNFQEVWFRGTVTYTSAGASYQGWYRSTQSITIPISSMTGMSAFADDATAFASGAHNSHIHTCSGLQSSGTAFEAQTLGMNAIAANTSTTGWNVYIAGYKR